MDKQELVETTASAILNYDDKFEWKMNAISSQNIVSSADTDLSEYQAKRGMEFIGDYLGFDSPESLKLTGGSQRYQYDLQELLNYDEELRQLSEYGRILEKEVSP